MPEVMVRGDADQGDRFLRHAVKEFIFDTADQVGVFLGNTESRKFNKLLPWFVTSRTYKKKIKMDESSFKHKRMLEGFHQDFINTALDFI